MSNRAWEKRRTKRGLAARQYDACQRKLRRAYKAKQPLPITVTSTGVGGLKLTVTVGPAEDRDDNVFDPWEDE